MARRSRTGVRASIGAIRPSAPAATSARACACAAGWALPDTTRTPPRNGSRCGDLPARSEARRDGAGEPARAGDGAEPRVAGQPRRDAAQVGVRPRVDDVERVRRGEPRQVARDRGGEGILRRRRLPQRAAVDPDGAVARGAALRRKRGRQRQARDRGRGAEGGQLRGDVAAQGRIDLLVEMPAVAGCARVGAARRGDHCRDAARGLARRHVTRRGVDHHHVARARDPLPRRRPASATTGPATGRHRCASRGRRTVPRCRARLSSRRQSPRNAAVGHEQPPTVSARGGSAAAFDGRCIPPLGVLVGRIFPICSLSRLERRAPPRLGATRHFHHGLTSGADRILRRTRQPPLPWSVPYACRRAHARCPAACSRHAVHRVGRQDRRDRSRLAPRGGVAGLHGRGPLARPRLDGMDAGLPVRLGAAAVRRHRRHATSSSWAARAPSSGWRRT